MLPLPRGPSARPADAGLMGAQRGPRFSVGGVALARRFQKHIPGAEDKCADGYPLISCRLFCAAMDAADCQVIMESPPPCFEPGFKM